MFLVFHNLQEVNSGPYIFYSEIINFSGINKKILSTQTNHIVWHKEGYIFWFLL
jgi:hypothetical protein